MDPHQPNEDNSSSGGGGGGGGGGAKGSFLCRQSSTRWTPTTDQIRILKDLYYNSGVRSPSAEQIQRISARLRQYGKIEGKNVFYWFQNHKARERQKKRFTSDIPMQQQQQEQVKTSSNNWKPDQDFSFQNKYPNITTPGFSCSSSASPSSTCGFSTVGQMGNYGSSLIMEKSFRECSISAGGSMSSNYGWVGIDPCNASSNYSFLDKQKSINIFDQTLLEDDQEQEQDQQQGVPEIETLPLFPTQREDTNSFCNLKHNQAICYSHNWYGSEHDGSNTNYRSSLELSLNSYSRRQAPDSI